MKTFKWYFLLLLISSCSGSKDTSILAECNTVAVPVINNNDTLLVCDVGKATQIITMPLSELADYRLVRLENTTKEMMISPISSIYISENYIVTVGNEYYNQIKLFDKSGEFIRSIGKAGNGPGEFVPSVFRIVIEEQQDRLFVADCNFSRMMVYSLSTGQYVCQIPFPHKTIMPSFIMNLQDSTMLVTHVPIKQSPTVLWKQDFQGNIMQQINPGRFESQKGFFMLGMDEFYLKRSKGKTMLSMIQTPDVNDSLYYYNDATNELRPYFAVNFPGDVPDHWIYETSDFYMITINGSTGGDISSGYHNGPQKRIIIDKKTGRGAYAHITLDGYGNIPITKQRFYIWGEYFTLTLSPEWLAEMALKALAHSEYFKPGEKERLQTLVDSITEEDNIFILYGKIK
ncbi:MAG: 6-bladed beta-propeller [Bacteroides sp.]|nr:6-bladed beta-propeller [Bacteroides sp.]